MQSLCCGRLRFWVALISTILALMVKEYLTIVSYNPMSLAFERAAEISISMPHVDVVMLPGTRLRTVETTRVRLQETDFHWHYFFGYHALAGLSNRSTGCSLLLNKKTFKKSSVKKLEWPEFDLAGRGGLVRIKTKQMDLAFVVAYYPPVTHLRSEKQRWRLTCKKLTDWLQQ